jgi:phospholipid/cholesterol/gamma-HCH transport system substrate-binding protein
MKKIFIKREIKVGIMTIIAIFVLYFGLNFLKGVDVFTPINYYYASYENVGGLVPSSPVFIKGFKVGQVEEVKYDFSKESSFVVKVSVSNDILIPKDAKIELFDNGLMGGKAIQFVYEPQMASKSNSYQSGDTIESQVGTGLMAQLSGELMPKIESIASQADSLLLSLRTVIDGEQLNNSLTSIESTTADLAVTSAKLKQLMNKDFSKILNDVSIISSDFKQVSGNLKKIDFNSTFESINHTISNLNLISDKMNSNEGTIGLLINDKSLYNNLNNTTANADKLIIDLKENPKRYVHFSLFGKKAE